MNKKSTYMTKNRHPKGKIDIPDPKIDRFLPLFYLSTIAQDSIPTISTILYI